MSTPALGLKTSVRTTLFRQTVQILQDDPVLKRAVKTWRVWSGKPDDSAEFAQLHAPGLRISPVFGPMTWWTPQQQQGKLIFVVEGILSGLDADDIMNFQSAIEDALFPPVQATMLAQTLSLQQNGARTGLYEYLAPLADPPNTAGSDGLYFRPMGQFALAYNRSFNA